MGTAKTFRDPQGARLYLWMILCRPKVVAFAAALIGTSCGGAPTPPSHASANVETQPAPVASAGLGVQGAVVGNAIDPSKVKGHLPREVIQKFVRADFDGMRRCYEEGLGRDPALKGMITTKFVIERDGTVSKAVDFHSAPPTEPPKLPADVANEVDGRRQTAEAKFPDPRVTECVELRFKALKFPRPQGGAVTVVYPIIFSPETQPRE